jgi:ribosomal-protein-alanine N-acetyltransferase
LVKYANNKEISNNVLNIPHPYNEADAVFRISYVHQGFRSKTHYLFAIVLKGTEGLIGEISLHRDSETIAQLGYWIGQPFWHKGFATEATKAILQFGFEKLNLDIIYAECHVKNKASIKVLLKNGMTVRGVNGNVVQYKLTKQNSKVPQPLRNT